MLPKNFRARKRLIMLQDNKAICERKLCKVKWGIYQRCMRCRFSRAQFLWVSVAQGTEWEGQACHYARQACPLSMPPQWCRLLSVIFGCEDNDDDAKDNELIGESVVTGQKRSSVNCGISKGGLSDRHPSLERDLILITIPIVAFIIDILLQFHLHHQMSRNQMPCNTV